MFFLIKSVSILILFILDIIYLQQEQKIPEAEF